MGACNRFPHQRLLVNRLLDLDVFCNVPASLYCSVSGAIWLLRRIFGLEFGEVERHIFCETIFAAAAACGHGSDQYFLHRNLEVLERILTGLAHGEQSLFEMLPVTTGQL